MIGKVPQELLETLVVSRTGSADSRVLQGPAYGEDTAAIRLGEETLVINTDPISLAVERIGTLGVSVVCNDVAASGASPEWLTSVIFLADSSEETLDEITRQLDAAASRLDISIVGGHAEYAPSLTTSMLVLGCFGLTTEYIPTGGARPGDKLLLTKSAGIEATGILASDFEGLVADEVSQSVIERGKTFYEELSVVTDAELVSEFAHAMHDPTEGGLIDGLLEMALASEVTLAVDPDSIPVRDTTARLCRAAGIDPLRTFGSGALLAAIPERDTERAIDRLRAHDIPATIIGTVNEADDPALVFGPTTFTAPVRDEMYQLWE